MRKISFIFAFIFCLILTSCVSSTAATIEDGPITVDVIISSGTPYYYSGEIYCYFYNGLYYYPYMYNDILYMRPYSKPFYPGYRPHFGKPYRGDIYRHHHPRRHGPAHSPRPHFDNRSYHHMNRPHNRPNTGNFHHSKPMNNHNDGHRGHLGGRR